MTTHILHNGQLFEIDRMPPDDDFHEETCDCDGCGDLRKEWRSFNIYLSTLHPIPHELKGEGIKVEGKDFEWRYEYKPANGDWRTTTDMELFDSLFSSQKRRVAVPIEAKEQASVDINDEGEPKQYITDYAQSAIEGREGEKQGPHIIIIDGNWYPAECYSCGWIGSSQYLEGCHAIADTGDYSDPLCPICSSKDVDSTEETHDLQSIVSKLEKAHKAAKYFRENYERVADELYMAQQSTPAPQERDEAQRWPGKECGLSELEWQMEQVIDEIRSKETTLECMAPLVKFLRSQHPQQQPGRERDSIEIRHADKWPPDKRGWYWCVVEGRPKALGMALAWLEYSPEEGGFLQDDDNFRVQYYLTQDIPASSVSNPAGFQILAEAVEQHEKDKQFLIEKYPGIEDKLPNSVAPWVQKAKDHIALFTSQHGEQETQAVINAKLESEMIDILYDCNGTGAGAEDILNHLKQHYHITPKNKQ